MGKHARKQQQSRRRPVAPPRAKTKAAAKVGVLLKQKKRREDVTLRRRAGPGTDAQADSSPTTRPPIQNKKKRLAPPSSASPAAAAAADRMVVETVSGKKRARGAEDARQAPKRNRAEAEPQLRRIGTREQRRQRVIVDEWDTGAQERLEASTMRQKDSGTKFSPAPATFVGESEEAKVRRLGSQMGDLAGPLLVSLWEADKDLETAPSSAGKPLGNHSNLGSKYAKEEEEEEEEEQRKKNPFAALATSSSENESGAEEDEPARTIFKPAILSRPGKLQGSFLPPKPRPLFAPATFLPPSSKPQPVSSVARAAQDDDDNESL